MKSPVYIGPCGLCPDCGEETPFRRASTFGDCEGAWVVEKDLLYSLATTTIGAWSESKKKILCKKCKTKPSRLHWIEVAKNAVIGPLCLHCLRKKCSDLPIYASASARTTYEAACAITYFQPKVVRVTIDADTTLF